MKRQSPCVGCTRVADPENCDNKNCKLWRGWFVARWEQMRGAVQAVTARQPDPCVGCLCPREMCITKCRERLRWEAGK